MRKLSLKIVVVLLFACPVSFGSSPQTPAAPDQLWRQISNNIDQAVKTAPAEVQARLGEVPSVAPGQTQTISTPAPPAKTLTIVTDAQKAALIATIDNFVDRTRKEQDRFSTLTTVFEISAAVLALLGSIASFLKFNKSAGVLGIVVLTVVGIPNVYPMAALADFYRSLANEAIALQTDCDLKVPFTLDDYQASEAQLKALFLFEGSHRPGLTSGSVSTEELTKQLQSVRTTTPNPAS